MKRKDTHFTCEFCKEKFEYENPKVWSEEDAKREYIENFPETQFDQSPSVLCDDCYKKVRDYIESLFEHEGERKILVIT